MSSEEQACLVRTRSDSENSARNLTGFGSLGRSGMAYSEGEGAPVAALQDPTASAAELGDSGELIQYQDVNVLAQFHEDAIRQAGFGGHQLMMGGVLGLALAAFGVEYASIPYVVPSADVEFCMTPRQKWWMGSITLAGIACGSVVWGNLSDRMGRRRTLLSCLGVNAVFSVIAAFMPTLGPFMMARFCSAIGIGGAPVSAVSALAELSGGRGRRARALPVLLGGAGLGALGAAGLAAGLLPATGPGTLIENREHFSAWHRYLLLCTLPTLFALVGLIWAHESPRYLLECGREVEALMIYQRIYKKNRSGGGTAAAGGGYQLSELELPPKRSGCTRNQAPPASVLADMANSVHQFCNSFLQLFSAPFARTTAVLAATLCCALFCQTAITVYSPSLLVRTKDAAYMASTERVAAATFNSELFAGLAVENVVYENCTFFNCTFRDVTFSHVMFRNCVFTDVEFSSIMSSYTFFEGSLFQGTRFIDTDLNTARHMDAGCRLVNSTILGLSPACSLETDHNIYMAEGIRTRAALAGAAAAAALLAALLGKALVLPAAVGGLVLASLSTPAIYFLHSETSIVAFSAVFVALLTFSYIGVTIIIVESYPVNLRCTAHGFIFSLANLSALIAAAIYANLTLNSYVLATLMTAFFAVIGAISSTRITDSCANAM